MNTKRKLLIFLSLLALFFLVRIPIDLTAKSIPFHSDFEITQFDILIDSLLPEGFNGLFAGSGECTQCHGFDTAGIASVNLLGEDLNLVDDWRASIMANSAKDPFWRAKVSHEVLLYPMRQQEIETKCTSCHAPLGHFTAMHNGQQYYSMAEMLADSIAQDGVSCLACHQQSQEQLGDLHSGHLNFDTAKVAYGPYISPLESPMVMASDYKPVYSPHISDAGLCAGCHTLITETLDYNGNYTGSTFVEQATYHEWLNSKYQVDSISCQSCHLEAMSKGQVIIAAGFDTEPRTPFYLHEISGANVFMLKLFRDNIEELGLAATAEQFDEAISSTEDMLYNKSIFMDLNYIDQSTHTAFFELDIVNLTGHKFPSGYPSRRVFVEFLVQDEFGDTLFISGKMDEDFEVIGHDPDYEPHYNVIRSEEEVQIYELVVADVNDEVTTVLVRGAYSLKDNRIPPEGFESTHAVYDTVQIAGLANNDPNFNKDSGIEGNGGDKIFYNIPLNGANGNYLATARIYYQTAPPKWMEELFDEQSEEIDKFRTLFDAADRQPILLKEKTIDIELIVGLEELEVSNAFAKVVSNPTENGKISIQSDQRHTYQIYDLKGTLIQRNFNNFGNYDIDIELDSGLYIIRFVNQDGLVHTEKIIIL